MTTNPWLPRPPEPEAAAAQDVVYSAALTGPDRPQQGVPAPDLVDQLPLRRVAGTADLWVVGAHGGAGESTIAELDDAWAAAAHAWPAVGPGGTAWAVVVARTSARGLLAAKAAAKQWATGLVPGVDLLGLVLVSDAPGRLPKPLRDLAKVISGGYPRTWQVPWIEVWRLGDDPSVDAVPREVRRLVDDLHALLQAGPNASTTNRKDRNDGTA